MPSTPELTEEQISDLVNEEGIKSAFKRIGISGEQLSDALKRGFSSVSDSIREAADYSQNLFDPENQKDFFKNIAKFKEEAGKLASGDSTQLLTSGLGVLSSALLKAKSDFAELNLQYNQGAAGSQNLIKNYEEMAQVVRNSKSPVELLTMSDFGKYLNDSQKKELASQSGTVEGDSKIRTALANAMEMAKNQEYLVQQIQYQAGQTGALDKLIDKTDGLKQINEYAAEYNKIITETASANGINRAEVIKYYESFSKIPGAMEQMVSASDLASEGNDRLLSSMITLSRGANISMSNLNDILGTLRNNFNMTFGDDQGKAGGDALKFMASMSKASNSLGLNFESLKSSISSISSSFAMYGNTSKDIVYAFHDVAKALEATGLSAENSGKMAQSYISHFSELSMAQKSYMSQMSGGPGGLMGAFQIEKDLREGNFKSVFEKFQTTLQKQVGPIVSEEEASQSEAAASARMRQLQILKSGPLGSMVRDDASAGRLLDSMAESAKGIKPLEESSKSLKDLYDMGKQRQSRESTTATMLEASLNEITSLAEIIAYNTSQQLVYGNESRGGVFGDTQASSVKEYIKSVQEHYKGELSKKTPSETGQASKTMYESVIPDMASSAYKGSEELIKANFAKTSEMIQRAFEASGRKDLAENVVKLREGGFSTEEMKSIYKDYEGILGTGLKPEVARVAETSAEDKKAKRAEEHKHTPVAQVSPSGGEVRFVCGECTKKMFIDARELAHALTSQNAAVTGVAGKP